METLYFSRSQSYPVVMDTILMSSICAFFATSHKLDFGQNLAVDPFLFVDAKHRQREMDPRPNFVQSPDCNLAIINATMLMWTLRT